LENLSDDEILKVNIPTGIPLVYELDEELKVLSKGYLGDQKVIKKAMDSVKNQSKVKSTNK
jgi:2,3-bisphosphoglycerate-dependent phosphoglycerate mutase